MDPPTASNITNINESRQPQMLRETIPLIVLATSAVIARFLCIRVRGALISADDYVIVAALISSYGDFAIVVVDTYLGLGKHTAVESHIEIERHYKINFASSIIYATSLALVKLSILLFYKRILPVPRVIVAARIIGFCVMAWWFSVVVVQIFSCVPVQGFWDARIPAHCVVSKWYWLGVAVPNILTDVVMLCVPVPVVLRLHMSTMQKVGVVITFMTGAFVIMASLYRVSLLSRANHSDPLWSYTDIAIWTSIEPSVAVICACLPTLRALLNQAASLVDPFGWKSRILGARTPERDQTLLNTITVRQEFHMEVIRV